MKSASVYAEILKALGSAAKLAGWRKQRNWAWHPGRELTRVVRVVRSQWSDAVYFDIMLVVRKGDERPSAHDFGWEDRAELFEGPHKRLFDEMTLNDWRNFSVPKLEAALRWTMERLDSEDEERVRRLIASGDPYWRNRSGGQILTWAGVTGPPTSPPSGP